MPCKRRFAYYSYKYFRSIVLLEICNANYCFSFVDIGAYGVSDDAGVLASFLNGSALDTIPSALSLPVQAKCDSLYVAICIIGR